MSHPYRSNETDDVPAGDPDGMLAIGLMLVLIVMLVLVALAFVRAV